MKENTNKNWKFKIKKKWQFIVRLVTEFIDIDPFLHSASISFYTLFSLPAVLFIMVQIAGYFWGQEAVSSQLYDQINEVVGNKAATTIQDILKNVEAVKSNIWSTILSVGVLLIGTTTVFISIQKGLNAIWDVKPKIQNNILIIIYDRLRSFTTVVALGFLIVVSLISDTVLLLLIDNLKKLFPDMAIYIIQLLNWFLSLFLTALMFSYIFVVLPYAKIGWKNGLYGGILTSILFFIGRYLISIYITTTNLDTTYGAAGSLVLILVWVYYSSLILLLGGKITEMKFMKKDI